MKKLFILLVILLFILSGCYGYTARDMDDLYEKMSEEYYELEEKYFDDEEKIEELESILVQIDELTADLYDYFEEDNIMSFEDARDAYWKIVDANPY